MIRRVLVAAALLGAMLATLATLTMVTVAASAMAQDSGTAVSVQDELFSPKTARVNAGSTVTWSNDGAENHTVTADDGSFDSGVLGSEESFAFTFVASGSYAYYCTLHGGPNGEGMAGIIVVN